MPHFDPTNAESEQAHYLEVAADLVQKYAPWPDALGPESVEYAERAARAERLLLNWLTQTKGGVLSGQSLSGVGSRSFAPGAERVARSIIAGTMPGYFTASSATLTVASTFPSSAPIV